jgi:hypothetical protein
MALRRSPRRGQARRIHSADGIFTLPVVPDGANGARFVVISAIGRDFVTNPRRTECKN